MADGAPVEVATVLCQWAAGGLAYLWVTTRRRELGLGYGWLLRSLYGAIAVIAAVVGIAFQPSAVRDVACFAMAACAFAALARSALPATTASTSMSADDQATCTDETAACTASLRSATARRDDQAACTDETAAATAPDAVAPARGDHRASGGSSGSREAAPKRTIAGFDPRWDLAAPAFGLIGVAAAGFSGDVSAPVLHLARLLAGAAFLGVVSDAMLLGHWYLVQPGLRREPLRELIWHLLGLWPVEVGLLFVPTGMVSVLTGAIDDGAGGLLAWFWAACALTTVALAAVAMAALRERQYAAVMAATGLLYLSILTAFGTDLVARLALAA